ncbi:MAG: hypothetical protein PVI06_15695 [Desulfobacterales bacterium]|jgi:hypothetical protein
MSKELNDHQKQVTGPFRFCHHVSAGRSNTPKRCMLNHECFHCAYDQWLDAIDLERGHGRVIADALKSNFTQAA